MVHFYVVCYNILWSKHIDHISLTVQRKDDHICF